MLPREAVKSSLHEETEVDKAHSNLFWIEGNPALSWSMEYRPAKLPSSINYYTSLKNNRLLEITNSLLLLFMTLPQNFELHFISRISGEEREQKQWFEFMLRWIQQWLSAGVMEPWRAAILYNHDFIDTLTYSTRR